MTFAPEISGLVATLALLLPFAALATVIALATRRTVDARSAASAGTEKGGLGRYGAPLAPSRPAAEARKGPPDGEDALAGLAVRLARAEAAGDEAEAARLHLEIGREKCARGRTGEAAGDLRKCIRLASRLGRKEVHAAARLELGDIARTHGDLTTACEHWQIARGLFHELARSRDLGEAEARMRAHGCPTDWVLNDF